MDEAKKQLIERLKKYTNKKIRDYVLNDANYKDRIKGVSAMTKDQIIADICELEGIKLDENTSKNIKARVELKNHIKELKKERIKALESKDHKTLVEVRQKIKSDKRKIRKMD